VSSAGNIKIKSVNNMSEVKTGFASLIGKRMTKKVKFMEVDVVISKLSVSQVKEIQNLAKAHSILTKEADVERAKDAVEMRRLREAGELEAADLLSLKEYEETDGMESMEILQLVLKSAVDGAEDISDEDFNAFPLDELSNLSTAIMEFSGVGGKKGK